MVLLELSQAIVYRPYTMRKTVNRLALESYGARMIKGRITLYIDLKRH